MTAALDFARLAAWYAGFATLKHLVPLRVLVRLARKSSGMRAGTMQAHASVARVVRLQRRLGAHRGDCLQAALVVYRELARAGREPRLVVGFARRDGRTTGHAWVEADGVPVNESEHDLRRFDRALAFGADGRPVTTGRD